MSTYALVGMVFIFLALIIYSIGVWSERFQGRLKGWHVGMFYVGRVCDSIGTGAMGLMSGGLIQFTFHGITSNETLIVKFHKFSLAVWIIWLIPMITGGIFGATV